MKILLLRSRDDDSYLPSFQRLPSLFGHKVVSTNLVNTNTASVEALAKRHECNAIACAQPAFLEAALHSLPDFIPPPTRKKITLDDYAGSLLKLRGGTDCLILNPLERLVTVPYEKYMVSRYLSKLTKPSKWFKQTDFKWRMVTDEQDATSVCARLGMARLLGVDIETVDTPERPIVCISYTGWFPDTGTTESYVLGFDQPWQWAAVRSINDNQVAKVFQNGSYDNAYFLRWGVPVRNWLHDTQHLFHCWYSELPKRLDFVATFALRNVRYWKDDGKTGGFTDLCRYCAMDGWATVNSYLALLAECPDWAITNYVEHEFPLVFPALHASLEGLDIDLVAFKRNGDKEEETLEARRKEISIALGVPDFNPNSPKQMMGLFTVLGCASLGSTDKAAMLKAKAKHPLNNFLLTLCTDYREAVKLHGTYFSEDKLWHSRLYYSIHVAATDTGRGASKESYFWCGFQIQNVPRGPEVKECIIAPPGWYIAEADKAQAEARCVGYLAGCQSLINLVESEHDYHAWNASAFFGVAYEKIYDEVKKKTLDKELRDLSKRTNHGANYNMGAGVMLDTMGPKKVAEAKRVLKLPAHWTLVQVCQFLLDRYAETYPEVKGLYYEHLISTIVTTDRLVSPLGWTRWFFNKPDKSKRATNVAVAHPSQNLSVAILNKEWYKIWRETVYGKLVDKVRIKAQIHDSLLFIHRGREYAEQVLAMMDTRVQVVGADGITRTLFIPSDLSIFAKDGITLATRWSELK